MWFAIPKNGLYMYIQFFFFFLRQWISCDMRTPMSISGIIIIFLGYTSIAYIDYIYSIQLSPVANVDCSVRFGPAQVIMVFSFRHRKVWCGVYAVRCLLVLKVRSFVWDKKKMAFHIGSISAVFGEQKTFILRTIFFSLLSHYLIFSCINIVHSFMYRIVCRQAFIIYITHYHKWFSFAFLKCSENDV